MFSAKDRDSNLTENGRITYRIPEVNTKMVQELFAINSETGLITLKKSPDYERKRFKNIS